ncbi:MAG: hypothetical protein ACRDPR_04850 [Nocardioidaceae bacterium]
MPLAGQLIRAADFAGFATANDTTDVAEFDSTSYTLGTPTVGVAFTAPTSGNVLLTWGGRLNLNSSTAQRILLSAEVRTGSTVGSGSVIAASNDDWAIEIGQSTNDRLQASRVRPVTGLTAGTTYNVSLWHRNAIAVTGSPEAGTLFFRDVTVIGVP